MFCKDCGNKIEAGSTVCERCNPSFKKVDMPNNTQFRDYPPVHYGDNNSTWKIIAISLGSIFMVLIIGLMSYLFLYPGKDGDSGNGQQAKNRQIADMIASTETEDNSVQNEVDKKALMDENEKLQQELNNKELLRDNEMLRDRINSLNQEVRNQGYTSASNYYGNSYNLSRSDLYNLTKTDIEYLRNEIYARNGYIFTQQPYKSHYSSMSWYRPNHNFSESFFSATERSNVNVIVAYEKDMGWR